MKILCFGTFAEFCVTSVPNKVISGVVGRYFRVGKRVICIIHARNSMLAS